MQTTPLRMTHLQADLDGLYKSVVDDFRAIRWENWMQTQFRRMEELHAGFFYGQQGPDGKQWAPNKPATIKRKGHGIVLVDRYRLLPSMTRPFADEAVRITVDEWPKATMIFGNTLPYSVINNLGNPAKNLPARVHIGLTRAFFDKMAESAVDFAREKLTR